MTKGKKERLHYTAAYILNPQHPVTINVIGAGGNGSQVLTQLARIDQALKKLDHPGIHVTCYDDDIVTDANLGRQLFSPAELGMNKAVVLITRLNRFFGTAWVAEPVKFGTHLKGETRAANILISCVDSLGVRKEISKCFYNHYSMPYATQYYWMDLGNSQSTGQYIIGSRTPFAQPAKSSTLEPVAELPDLFKKFPGFKKQKDLDDGPSCSLAEALKKQDLFINSFLVQAAMANLWKMFREGKIKYHGAFVNLQTMDIAPIYL